MNVSEIMSAIKKATAFDIFLISFFALPFVYDAWIEVFTKIGWNPNQIFWSLIILSLLYIVAVVVLGVDNYSKKRKEIAKDRILGYLRGKDIRWVGFERIRKNISPSYTDEFLEKLVQEFPREIREVKLKSGKTAIGTVVIEAMDEEEI